MSGSCVNENALLMSEIRGERVDWLNATAYLSIVSDHVHLCDVVEWEIRIMDVQPTNLQQLRDAIMSIWTKISEECFQHLVESIPQRIKAVLKAKGSPTRY